MLCWLFFGWCWSICLFICCFSFGVFLCYLLLLFLFFIMEWLLVIWLVGKWRIWVFGWIFLDGLVIVIFMMFCFGCIFNCWCFCFIDGRWLCGRWLFLECWVWWCLGFILIVCLLIYELIGLWFLFLWWFCWILLLINFLVVCVFLLDI